MTWLIVLNMSVLAFWVSGLLVLRLALHLCHIVATWTYIIILCRYIFIYYRIHYVYVYVYLRTDTKSLHNWYVYYFFRLIYVYTTVPYTVGPFLFYGKTGNNICNIKILLSTTTTIKHECDSNVATANNVRHVKKEVANSWFISTCYCLMSKSDGTHCNLSDERGRQTDR